MTPIAIDVGLSQLVTRSPAAFPTGTRPDAIPPIAAPSANGVRIEETANAISTDRCSRNVTVPVRIAYAVPRSTIPMPATKSGTASVEQIEPNARGYAVQQTTSTKISQT